MPQMLYDSDSFVVVHDVGNNDEIEKLMEARVPHDQVEPLVQHIYEIVDKRNAKTVCLHGAWARAFLLITTEWMHNTPDQEAVERVLEGYTQLAQLPVVLH